MYSWDLHYCLEMLQYCRAKLMHLKCETFMSYMLYVICDVMSLTRLHLICISVVLDAIGVGPLEVVLFSLNLVHCIWSLLISHILLATLFT